MDANKHGFFVNSKEQKTQKRAAPNESHQRAALYEQTKYKDYRRKGLGAEAVQG